MTNLAKADFDIIDIICDRKITTLTLIASNAQTMDQIGSIGERKSNNLGTFKLDTYLRNKPHFTRAVNATLRGEEGNVVALFTDDKTEQVMFRPLGDAKKVNADELVSYCATFNDFVSTPAPQYRC